MHSFAAGDTHLLIGLAPDGEGSIDRETIVLEGLSGTRTVAGVDCARVRDRVYEDGLLIEDTEDWYAQDDAGNVWYMGEEVINYEYDENGVLTGTNTDGSWEAGLDVAGVGVLAVAGWSMPAQPKWANRSTRSGIRVRPPTSF